jgi:hypothetical protein
MVSIIGRMILRGFHLGRGGGSTAPHSFRGPSQTFSAAAQCAVFLYDPMRSRAQFDALKKETARRGFPAALIFMLTNIFRIV